MKSLITPHGSFLTGSAIADAVVRYDAALSDAGFSERVTVPMRADGDHPQTVSFVIGWRNEIEAAEPAVDGSEIVDEGVVSAIERSAAEVRPLVGIPFAPEELEGVDWCSIGPDEAVA